MRRTDLAVMVIVGFARFAECRAQAAPGVGGGLVSEMNPDRVNEAIAAASSADPRLPYVLISSNAAPIATYTTPFARVVIAARDAKRKYRPFSPADVTQGMVAPEVQILAMYTPFDRRRSRANVETVVLLPVGSTDPSAAVQPTRTEPVIEESKNVMGATFQTKGLLARFPISAVRDDYEVVVVFDGPVAGLTGDCTECRARFKLDRLR